MILTDSHWLSVKDGDPRALALYRKHYSSSKGQVNSSAQMRFAGQGEHKVLLTEASDALFVWRLQQHRLDDQRGVECSVFRNESQILSSELIREADEIAWRRWPNRRLFTFVDRLAVRSSNPGMCFIKAGWRRCGVSADGKLLVLEHVPNACVDVDDQSHVDKDEVLWAAYELIDAWDSEDPDWHIAAEWLKQAVYPGIKGASY